MKTRTFVSILILGAICFLVSCASLQPATDEDQNKTFTDVTYDQLFAAVKDAYLELDIAIIAGSKDKESGSLIGQTRSAVAFSDSGLWYRHYETMFFHSGTGTKIQIEIYMERGDGLSVIKEKKVEYDAFWGVVQKNLY